MLISRESILKCFKPEENPIDLCIIILFIVNMFASAGINTLVAYVTT